MNTKERFMKALHLEPVDRPSVAAVVTGITVWMMERAGIFWPEAHTDSAKMARYVGDLIGCKTALRSRDECLSTAAAGKLM